MRLFMLLGVLLLSSCLAAPAALPQPPPTTAPPPTQPVLTAALPVTITAAPIPSTLIAAPTLVLTPSPAKPPVPPFKHILILIFENKEFSNTIGNWNELPLFNQLAQDYTLLTAHYAVTHPSLPNYLALAAGDTFGVTVDYPSQTIAAASIADEIEQSGRTWKTYLESMPSDCYLKDTLLYELKHNPFAHFDSILADPARCKRSMVPLSTLESDLAQGTLPDFAFIVPNACHSSHDSYTNTQCPLKAADDWLGGWIAKLKNYPGLLDEGLIIITWDEGQGDHACCGIEKGGGRVATILVSNLVKPGFQDATPYTHYSILKTIAAAWGLPDLGHTADPQTALIRAPWK
jgi:phospholipase C